MKFNILKIKTILKLFLRPNGKVDFLNSIPKNSFILDVGCGNNSPLLVKTFLPKPGECPSEDIQENGWFDCKYLVEAEDGQKSVFPRYIEEWTA